MSEVNQRYVDELGEIEYAIRDGLVLSEEQKRQVKVIAEYIIGLVTE
jgi:hypothetical protein